MKRFELKWGLLLTDPFHSFDEIIGENDTVELDRHDEFNDIYRRLYGDSFYGADKLVQCPELDALYQLSGKLMLALNSGHLAKHTNGFLCSQAVSNFNFSIPKQIHLTINADANPIAVLFKVQWIMRVIREARVHFRLSEPFGKRIVQQLDTLEKRLDADLVGARKDFSQDDVTFRVWDLKQTGMKDSDIARSVWPGDYRRRGGRDSKTGDKNAIIQRVYDHYARANGWIKQFAETIRNDEVEL